MPDDRHITHPNTRDLPHSAKELATSWVQRSRKEITMFKSDEEISSVDSIHSSTLDNPSYPTPPSPAGEKGFAKYWPIITTGAGLFSDGYVNNSISTASTCLSKIYGKQYTNSNAIQNVSSIAFAGTVVGQLAFGYIADYHSRKTAMIVGTLILILFSILCAGAWGVGTTGTEAGGLFAAITAYRFFLGIGIGSEYPAGSTAAAEASNLLPAGKRNRWFCWFTNFMIDMGFVISAVVPVILLKICGTSHLSPVWRITMGLGAIPPISLFFLRLKYNEGEQYQKTKFTHVIPYWKVVKFYWFRLTIVSIIWFLYDFSAYAFGTYSSLILSIILGDDTSIVKSFGWNVVFNLFYIPGAFLGAIFADYWGPRVTLATGVTLQAVVGFIMAGCFENLRKHIGAFVVVYGIFMTLGEFGPGDNIGVLASKTCATPIRGHYYGIAAAVGKVGAFVGTYVFPSIIRKAGGFDSTSGLQAPYWVASSLCCFSALLALFLLPSVDQDAIVAEDRKFLEYLESTGYNITELGVHHDEYAEKVSTSHISTSDDSKNQKDNIVVHEQ